MDSDNEMTVVKDPKGYALSGKIMLSAIVILFGVVVFMVLLHLYARWYLERMRSRDTVRRRNRINRRTQIVYYVDSNQIPGSVGVSDRGLERHVLNSLPVFAYSSSKKPGQVLECAVCLSEFEDEDKGRLLPKCKHSFHIECIDMWFHSHSTCPLCRARVEEVPEPERSRLAKAMESGWSLIGGGSGRAPSFGSRRKGFDWSAVRIEVPRRSELEIESAVSTPASQEYRSPGSRMLSIKKILSMNKRSPASSGTGTSCSESQEGSELDLETGSSRPQSHAPV